MKDVPSSASSPSCRARSSRASSWSVEAVALGVQLPLRQQPAFLGEEQEHDPHHHRDGGLRRRRAGRRAAARGRPGPSIGRALAERLDEQLDRPAHLHAEGLGDLLGGGDRLGEQLRQPVLGAPPTSWRACSSAANASRACASSTQVCGVDDPGGDHGLRARAHQPPPPPVGDDADRHAAGPQHRLHPVDRAGRPAVVEQVAQAGHRVDHPQQRPAAVAAHQRPGRLDRHRAVRRRRPRARPHGCRGVVGDQQLAPAEHLAHHDVDPGVPRRAVCRQRVVGLLVAVPGVPGLLERRLRVDEPGPGGVRQRRHTLRPHPLERRDREERPLLVHERQPGAVLLGHRARRAPSRRHRAPAQSAASCGVTAKTTAAVDT